jgi:hypothetical protein
MTATIRGGDATVQTLTKRFHAARRREGERRRAGAPLPCEAPTCAPPATAVRYRLVLGRCGAIGPAPLQELPACRHLHAALTINADRPAAPDQRRTTPLAPALLSQHLMIGSAELLDSRYGHEPCVRCGAGCDVSSFMKSTGVPLRTSCASAIASQLVRRMQPCEAVLLILSGSGVPWMP